jgi:hypothetical protein
LQAQGGFNNIGASSAGTDTYAVTPTVAIRAYVDGACYVFEADVGNTLAATLNISALGAISILRSDGAALATGDIDAGEKVQVCYDSTGPKFQLNMGIGGGGGGAPTDAQYLVSAEDATLSAEDVVTAGTGIIYANGAGTGTFSVDTTVIPSLGGNNTYTGHDIHTPSAPQAITAVGDAILANAAHVEIDSDASYTLTSTPTIADGTDGQRLTICNIDTAFNVTLQDKANLASSNLSFDGTDYIIQNETCVDLRYNGTLSSWTLAVLPGTAAGDDFGAGDPGANGLMARTAADTSSARTITGTAAEITVTNGDGVSGNPTLSLPAVIDLGGKVVEVPNGAAPTVDAVGELAVDTTVTDLTGVVRVHDGTEELALIPVPVAELSSLVNGDTLVYNATDDEFKTVSPEVDILQGSVDGSANCTGGLITIGTETLSAAWLAAGDTLRVEALYHFTGCATVCRPRIAFGATGATPYINQATETVSKIGFEVAVLGATSQLWLGHSFFPTGSENWVKTEPAETISGTIDVDFDANCDSGQEVDIYWTVQRMREN